MKPGVVAKVTDECLYRSALPRVDAVGDVVDDLLIGSHPVLFQHSLDAGHELLRPGVHHADVGDEETAAYPVLIRGDQKLGGVMGKTPTHLAVGDGIVSKSGWQKELEGLQWGTSADGPTVGETSEKSNVQPAEVARSKWVLRRRSAHELVLGVHRRRVVGVDSVRKVPRVSGLAEDGVDARHQTESPKFRTPDEDESCHVLRNLMASDGLHVTKVALVVEVGDDWVVDELERRHPASVDVRREHLILRTFGKRSDVEVRRHDGNSVLKKGRRR